MREPDQQWRKLVNAARQAPLETAGDGDEPPKEFVSRILGFHPAIANFVRALAWRRWSVIVALLSAGVFLVVLAVIQCSEDPEPLITPPKSTSAQP